MLRTALNTLNGAVWLMTKIPNSICGQFRCPVCGSELVREAANLRCVAASCALEFPVVDGIPVLINEQRSLFKISEFANHQATYFPPVNRLRAVVSRWLPDVSRNPTACRYFETLRRELHTHPAPRPVLILGGGILGAGIERLVTDPELEILETDIAFAPRTQVICDAHDLPFADESFQAVVVQAVLEHVLDPIRCVAEIRRVLKPDGIVCADTPFIQQVHGREFDFTRFTRLGHRRLFREFDEIESGITGGPGQALAWSMRYFLLSFFSSPLLRGMASGLARAAFFWLKYLDPLLINKPGALDAASGFYFLGRKTNRVLSDRELVASYRGGF